MKIIFSKRYKRLIHKEQELKRLRSDLAKLESLSYFDKLVKKYNEMISCQCSLSELSGELNDYENDPSFMYWADEADKIKQEYNKLVEELKV